MERRDFLTWTTLGVVGISGCLNPSGDPNEEVSNPSTPTSDEPEALTDTEGFETRKTVEKYAVSVESEPPTSYVLESKDITPDEDVFYPEYYSEGISGETLRIFRETIIDGRYEFEGEPPTQIKGVIQNFEYLGHDGEFHGMELEKNGSYVLRTQEVEEHEVLESGYVDAFRFKSELRDTIELAIVSERHRVDELPYGFEFVRGKQIKYHNRLYEMKVEEVKGDFSPLEFSVEVQNDEIVPDSPAEIEFTVKNTTDSRLEVSGSIPPPFGVVRAYEKTGEDSLLLWTDSYQESQEVSINGRGISPSYLDTETTIWVESGEEITETYKLFLETPGLETGEYIIEDRIRTDSTSPEETPYDLNYQVALTTRSSSFTQERVPAPVECVSMPSKLVYSPERWSSGGYNRGNMSYNPAVIGPKSVEVLWSFEADNAVNSTPVASDGLIYVVDERGVVYALNDGGRVEWRSDPEVQDGFRPTSMGSSITTRDRTVYVGGGGFARGGTDAGTDVFLDGKEFYIRALEAKTGEEKWRFEPDSLAKIDPVVVGGTVFFIANQTVYAVHTDDGSLRWRRDVEDTVEERVTQKSPTTQGNEKVEGKGNREIRINGPRDSVTPALGDCSLYSGTESGFLSLDAGDGSVEWTSPVAESYSPAFHDGTVYVPGDGVYALSSDGETEWNHETKPESSVAVGDRRIYFGDDSGDLRAISKSDGSSLWSVGGSSVTSPSVTNHTVYFGDKDGVMRAVSKKGDEVWSFRTDASVRSSPIVVEGTVYVADTSGKVYALGGE